MGHYGGSYKVTYDLYKKYGDMRLLDTPICGTCPRFPDSCVVNVRTTIHENHERLHTT